MRRKQNVNRFLTSNSGSPELEKFKITKNVTLELKMSACKCEQLKKISLNIWGFHTDDAA